MNSDNDDFEKLIELAETISNNIMRLKWKLKRINYFIQTAMLGTIFGLPFAIAFRAKNGEILLNIFNDLSTEKMAFITIVFVLIISIFTVFIHKTLHDFYEVKKTIKIEQDNLEIVFKMVNEFKEVIIEDSSSYVNRAILELRLRRIRFSLT